MPIPIAAIGRPEIAVPVAAAAANESRVAAGAEAAVVVAWGSEDGLRSGSPFRSVRSLALAIGDSGLRAVPCGRIVWVWLPDEPTEAACEIDRLVDSLEVPVVLGLFGPRVDEFEGCFASCRMAAFVIDDVLRDELYDLAARSVPCGTVIVDPLPTATKLLALAGYGRLRELRAFNSDRGDAVDVESIGVQTCTSR